MSKQQVLTLVEQKTNKRLNDIRREKSSDGEKLQEIRNKVNEELNKKPVKTKVAGYDIEIKKGRFDFGIVYTDKRYKKLQDKIEKFNKDKRKKEEEYREKANDIREKIILHGVTKELVELIEEL